VAATAAAAGAEGPVWILQLRYQVEIGVNVPVPVPHLLHVMVPVMSRLWLCTTTMLECAVVLDVMNLYLADNDYVENVQELKRL
jgi:hypothetical protein